MDIAAFREAFPCFTPENAPDARVQFYLSLAARLLPEERWQDLHSDGIALFTAHNLALEAEMAKDKSGAGAIEAAAGPIVSESRTVGSMSKSVTRAGSATQGSSSQNAGQYNLTVYGQQFWQLLQIVGAGGMAV